MKKAYKELYLEAIKEVESYKKLYLIAIDVVEEVIDKSDEQGSMLDETVNRLNGIASNNVMLRDKVNRYRVISFMLGMGLLAQYCLFRFY